MAFDKSFDLFFIRENVANIRIMVNMKLINDTIRNLFLNFFIYILVECSIMLLLRFIPFLKSGERIQKYQIPF